MMKLSDLFNNKSKYVIALTSTFIVVAVVLLCVFLSDNSNINNNNEVVTKETVNETTPTDGDEEDPENQDFNQSEGNIIDSEELSVEAGRTNGIDVSKWQGVIDWKKVKDSQIEFAFIRIGYRGENGIIYKDEFAEYNLQQAHKYGVLTGVYFFSTATNEVEAEEEAAWVLKFIEGYNISYPVVYDCEGYKLPTSRMFGIGADLRTEIALAFLDKVSAGGYDTMLYGAKNEIESPKYWDITKIEKGHKIWVAQYSEIAYPDVLYPQYSGKINAWQFTNKGIVNGIDGNVDMVVCYFEEGLKQPKNPNIIHEEAKEPSEDGADVYNPVNERVTAKDITNLREMPTTKSNVVIAIKRGEYVTRVGIGNKGWSMLEYNGQTVYAITSYLITEDEAADSVETNEVNYIDEVIGVRFEKYNDKVTAKIKVNLRSLPSTTDGEIVGSLESGTFLDRVAKSSQGWSRLMYNGVEVYAVSSYLSNEIIIQTTQPETNPSNDFSPVDEMVTAKIETNLRSKPTTEGSEIIYTLKNGEYVKRIGINSTSGWSMLEYNGNTVYAVSSYLVVQE